MSAPGSATPRVIANFIITKLTDATIYLQDLYEARVEKARRRALQEADRQDNGTRCRALGDIDDDVSLMGDREAEEGRPRPH
jgi:hypothetical protein